MGFARKDVETTKRCEKKFVRYQEGAEKYVDCQVKLTHFFVES